MVNAVTGSALRLAPSLLVSEAEIDEAVGSARAPPCKRCDAVTRHFLDVDDLSPAELATVLDLARDDYPPRVLAGRGVALVFQKPSARTRNSSEMAVFQLGGHPVTIRGDEVGIDTREAAEDVARTLAQYHCRDRRPGARPRVLDRMAAVSTVPVINLLSDRSHPLQAVADLLTLQAHWGGELAGHRVAWVGDGNNVARSLTLACAMAGRRCRTGQSGRARVWTTSPWTPPSPWAGRCVEAFSPDDAVAEAADAVCTDVWVSMGQEAESAPRRDAFARLPGGRTLMAKRPRAPSSCTACPPTGARRSRPRS